MSQQANPRGTFVRIAEMLKTGIETDPDVTELPALSEVMSDHNVSRGVALRAFAVLKQGRCGRTGAGRPVARRAR
ncbi:hypothetical protein GCM10010104_37910 [Streptomyces indiaensis]|uniref:Regulatory protein, gntR family n=1 Tax=Streptomyces indiaensis TaxID=284033 RepID=A0ABN3DQF3_9ACTN